MPKTPWETHDFKVTMLDWSADRGFRLAHLCRLCGRRFCQFTLVRGQGPWAVDSKGYALDSDVSDDGYQKNSHVSLRRDENDRKRPDDAEQ